MGSVCGFGTRRSASRTRSFLLLGVHVGLGLLGFISSYSSDFGLLELRLDLFLLINWPHLRVVLRFVHLRLHFLPRVLVNRPELSWRNTILEYGDQRGTAFTFLEGRRYAREQQNESKKLRNFHFKGIIATQG